MRVKKPTDSRASTSRPASFFAMRMNSLAASDLPSSTAGTPLFVVAIDLIVERDRAEQVEREDLDDVGLREHVALLHEVRARCG